MFTLTVVLSSRTINLTYTQHNFVTVVQTL